MESKGSLWAFLRPATLVAFLMLSFVAATGFLASLHKFDLILGFKAHNSTSNVWPGSGFWRRLSAEPRLPYNRCPFSGCPNNDDHNQSQFKYPFNADDACPFYFRYIHEDLAPWASHHYDNQSHDDTNDHHNSDVNHDHPNNDVKDGNNIIGVSREMLDSARPLASFRVVIKSGRLYVDAYQSCFQTRAVFTVWGLLQLLKLYPALVPDVDMLFGCGDTPKVTKSLYKQKPAPPIFRYCSTPNDFDIPFPDWSFWGWPEVDLASWDKELSGILKGENELLWEQRRPTAFWKGNTDTGGRLRKELKSCNGAHNGAEIIHQNWYEAYKAHYKNSRLAQQCKNRYKIYVEGWGWSVSLKYIMACDSPVLLVNPVFHDFFTRGLMPMKHFWPVGRDKLCNSIKFGVEWGNNHPIEAETLGRAGRQFITKEVSMKHVYDYMLHALHEYAKLLQFVPTPGHMMTEVCSEAFLCQAPDKEKPLYEETMVRQPSGSPPCFLPLRDEKLIEARLQQRLSITNLILQAETNGNRTAAESALSGIATTMLKGL